MQSASASPRPLAALVLAGALALPASAQTPLTTTLVASGFNEPTEVVVQPDDPDRLFVAEKDGFIRIIDHGTVLPTPFLDIDGIVNSAAFERGLLGLAFHPDYAENGFFYVNYTRVGDGTTVVARYSVSAGDPNLADPGSAATILTQSQPASNHNAGCLRFGPLDGYLYVAFGDGGEGNDPFCNGQNPNTWLGKILRLDVDSAFPYAIPADNPFVGQGTYLEEIWSYGHRNPWKFTFDRETGDMWIGDVGQSGQEEVSFEPALTGGRNYGWPMMEGNDPNMVGFNNCPAGQVPPPLDPSLTDPVFQITHTGPFGGPCAVIGGLVYRGCAIPDLQGTYFVTDNCDPDITSFTFDGVSIQNVTDRTAELDPPGAPTIANLYGWSTDANGEILLFEGGGEIWKIVPAAPVGGADCDANGQIDSCEIGQAAFKDLDLDGTLDLCESFSADTAEIPLSDGGSQAMSLHAGGAHGGKLYWVLGTTSGAGALPVDGVVLPLNVFSGPALNPYTLFTVSSPNTGLLSSSFNALDAGGNGAASFNVPPAADPALAGAVFHHAYLLTNGSGFDFASNFLTVTLVP